ncbi:MAG: hypothetical protein KAJ78_04430 [Acidobacteria bacterium]|nr:hypothetical protein [Acidobacteriota bacterium]
MLGFHSVPGSPGEIVFSGGYVYVSTQTAGVSLLDVRGCVPPPQYQQEQEVY